MMSFKMYLLKKNDLEEYIFNLEKYVTGEFVICLTRSFKKHGSYRATVNTSTDVFFIREEDSEYIFDKKQMKDIYDKQSSYRRG